MITTTQRKAILRNKAPITLYLSQNLCCQMAFFADWNPKYNPNRSSYLGGPNVELIIKFRDNEERSPATKLLRLQDVPEYMVPNIQHVPGIYRHQVSFTVPQGAMVNWYGKPETKLRQQVRSTQLLKRSYTTGTNLTTTTDRYQVLLRLEKWKMLTAQRFPTSETHYV